MKRRFTSILVTFVICFVFWMLLTTSFEPRELVGGAVVCAISAWFSSAFFMEKTEGSLRWLNPLRWLKMAFYFVFILLGEIVKANINMAKMVITNRPFKQAIIKVPVRDLEDEYALAILADSITLTPGTITMDVAYDKDGSTCMYVHWIDMETDDNEKAGEIIKGRMEKWIRRAWK